MHIGMEQQVGSFSPTEPPKKSLLTAPQRLLTNQPLPTAEEENGEQRRSLAAAH